MRRFAIIGTQWGDEGKGKITDFLAQNVDVVVRYQGGNNAGHTVVIGDSKYALHLLPSGILNKEKINVMANGMVINLEALITELNNLDNKEYQLFISDRAHVTFPFHLVLDGIEENKKVKKIGTTKKGIGPTYNDKYARIGLRVSDVISDNFKEKLTKLVDEKNAILIQNNEQVIDFDSVYNKYQQLGEMIKPLVVNTSQLLNTYIKEDKTLLFEGAQGVMLCIDHGTYPFVTSSSPTAAQIPVATGIAPWLLDGAIGVTKAYTTRVGEGAMPSEIFGDLAQDIRIKGNEFWTTTKRPRRIGWLDTVVLNYTKMVSGISYLAITLLDVLSGLDKINIVTGYKQNGEIINTIPATIEAYEACEPIYVTVDGWQEDITNVKSFDELPMNAKKYLQLIEQLTDTEIAIFSVGPRRDQTIVVKDIITGK